MELLKTVQQTIVASSFALFYTNSVLRLIFYFFFAKGMKVFVHLNTKVNNVAFLILTNDMALTMKDQSDLSCSHDIIRHSQKPSIYS